MRAMPDLVPGNALQSSSDQMVGAITYSSQGEPKLESYAYWDAYWAISQQVCPTLTQIRWQGRYSPLARIIWSPRSRKGCRSKVSKYGWDETHWRVYPANVLEICYIDTIEKPPFQVGYRKYYRLFPKTSHGDVALNQFRRPNPKRERQRNPFQS